MTGGMQDVFQEQVPNIQMTVEISQGIETVPTIEKIEKNCCGTPVAILV